jgi:predicted ribonuclease YlaK
MIDQVYRNNTIPFSGNSDLKRINSYLLLKSETENQKTAIVRVSGKNTITKVSKKSFPLSGISPKDSRQSIFTDMLTNNLPVVAAIGPAGTGKTTIAIAHAISQHLSEKKKVYLSKPTSLVGNEDNAFGPVPGGIEEKYAPYISSFTIVLKKILGNKSEEYLKLMISKKDIEYIPVEFTRGCTYENCTFILDEAQNLTWHELKSVVSRMGEGAQLIILGDPQQIDTTFRLQDGGLYTMLTSRFFLESPVTGCIYLTKQYRGPIAELVARIDEELSNRLIPKQHHSESMIGNTNPYIASG